MATHETLFGQATGRILGSVLDPSSASMPGVTVTATEPSTGVQRSATTNGIGSYGFSSLQPGDYEISVEMAGFKKAIKRATVNIGRDITVDFTLEVGEVNQTVEVSAGASAINLVDSKVDAIVEQSQISDLPLNGRSAFEMAKFVPGVRVTNSANRNADNQISIAGRGPESSRFSVDGLNISDLGGGGGEGINLSQDVVREFQVSINNSDPSIGIMSGGAVNLITRSGSNELHGRFSTFFRDSQYAAFPGLARGVLKPNPTNDPVITAFNDAQVTPPLYRRQNGGYIGGPLVKDRIFWLASLDYQKQVAAATFDTNSADLAAFNGVHNYPRQRFLQNYRIDWRANDKHSFFARFSRDALLTRTSGSASLPATWDSFEVFRDNHTYNAMLAWTAVWSPSLVSDLRLGFTRVNIVRRTVPDALEEARLYAPLLTSPLTGAPRLGSTAVSGVNFSFGAEQAIENNALGVQPQVTTNFTYMSGKHTIKFGGGYSPLRYLHAQTFSYPYQATLFNPTQARQAGISLPSSFRTIGVMQLPLSSITLAVGRDFIDPQTFGFPGHDILWTPQSFVYVGDSYKMTPRLTLNFSLGYNYDPTINPNRDMPRPASITPLLDGGVRTFGIRKTRFSPSFGFAWDPFGGGRTVIRGGFGVYYTTGAPIDAVRERGLLAPLGDGYALMPGNAITNPKTGVGTLTFGSAAANAAAGVFRLSDFVTYASGIRDRLEQTTFTGKNTDFSVTNFDFFKGNATNSIIVDPNNHDPYSLQAMVGVQRQVSNDWLFDITGIYNVTNHLGFSLDANRQFRPANLGGPILPAFASIQMTKNAGKSNYRALLISTKKRLSRRYQLSAAYTFSSYKLTSSVLTNYNDYRGSYGYDPLDRGHVFTFTGTVELRWGVQVSLISNFQSKPPFNPFLSGLDLNGDGTADDRLPGLPINAVNRGYSEADVRKLAADFNQAYAGKRDARGTLIQPINLGSTFDTGDSIINQDMRVTKSIRIKERYEIELMGEVFNVLNIANLSYVASSGNVYSTGFGKPSARLGNLFGSDGPRAFQFAARFSF